MKKKSTISYTTVCAYADANLDLGDQITKNQDYFHAQKLKLSAEKLLSDRYYPETNISKSTIKSGVYFFKLVGFWFKHVGYKIKSGCLLIKMKMNFKRSAK